MVWYHGLKRTELATLRCYLFAVLCCIAEGFEVVSGILLLVSCLHDAG